MKRLVFAVAAMTLGFGVSAQTIVSTEVQKRNAVIEEYTGIGCGYCPLGHQNVSEFSKANPGRVVTLNIHQGGYTQGYKPNFTTKYGDKMAAQADITGYPAGTLNRTRYHYNKYDTVYNEQGTPIALKHVKGTGKEYPIGNISPSSLALWSYDAADLLEEESPVNVAATAKIDAATREITVHVEVYYTKDVTANENLLNVALLQNNVKADQHNYGNYNPDQITPDGEYLHMHMLRDFLSREWGDTVATANEEGIIPAGTFWEKTYTAKLPESYKDYNNGSTTEVPFVLGDIDLAVYIAEGTPEDAHWEYPYQYQGKTYTMSGDIVSGNIYTGVSVTPEYENVSTLALNAVVNGLILAPVYGKCDDKVQSGVMIRNLGGENITNVKINYGVEGKDEHTYTWTGDLGFTESTTIELPEQVTVTLGTNTTVYASITEVNSKEFDAKTTSKIKKATIKNGVAPIKLTLKTDKWASDISWFVYDSEGNVLHQSEGYEDGSIIRDTVILTSVTEDGCYLFEILDAYADGVDGGNYKILSSDGTVLASNTTGSWGAGEKKDFRVGAVGLNEASENIFQSIVYPNPAKTDFTLSVSVNNPSSAVINVIDIMGRTVLTLGEQHLQSGENQFNINTSSLDNGMYYVRVVTNNGITTNKISIAK